MTQRKPRFESYAPGEIRGDYAMGVTDHGYVRMVWRVRERVFAKDPYADSHFRQMHVDYPSPRAAHIAALKLRKELVENGDPGAILRWYEET